MVNERCTEPQNVIQLSRGRRTMRGARTQDRRCTHDSGFDFSREHADSDISDDDRINSDSIDCGHTASELFISIIIVTSCSVRRANAKG